MKSEYGVEYMYERLRCGEVSQQPGQWQMGYCFIRDDISVIGCNISVLRVSKQG
jgi:hypothetical protein